MRRKIISMQSSMSQFNDQLLSSYTDKINTLFDLLEGDDSTSSGLPSISTSSAITYDEKSSVRRAPAPSPTKCFLTDAYYGGGWGGGGGGSKATVDILNSVGNMTANIINSAAGAAAVVLPPVTNTLGNIAINWINSGGDKTPQNPPQNPIIVYPPGGGQQPPPPPPPGQWVWGNRQWVWVPAGQQPPPGTQPPSNPNSSNQPSGPQGPPGKPGTANATANATAYGGNANANATAYGGNANATATANSTPGQYPPPPGGQKPPSGGQQPPPGQYPPSGAQQPPPGQYPPSGAQQPPPGQYSPPPGQWVWNPTAGQWTWVTAGQQPSQGPSTSPYPTRSRMPRNTNLKVSTDATRTRTERFHGASSLYSDCDFKRTYQDIYEALQDMETRLNTMSLTLN